MAQPPLPIPDLNGAAQAIVAILAALIQPHPMQNQPPGGQNDPAQAENDRLDNLRFGINAHRGLLPADYQRLNVAQIIGTQNQLTQGDRDQLMDLLLKQFSEHHGIDEIPDNDWKEKWYKSLFNGNWNSTIKPTRPQLLRRQGVESAIVAGTLRVDCPPPSTSTKRSRAEYEEQEIEAPIDENVAPIPIHRRRGATVLMRVNASLLTIRIMFLDSKSRLIPESCVILKAPIENVIAEAMVHFDTNEQTRISLFNRQFLYYQARCRLHHWLHVGRRHENVPNETAFVLQKPKNILLFQQRLAAELHNRLGEIVQNGRGLADEFGEGEINNAR
ncbi:uncharacterized protein EAE98_008460 [Botrytis deweyae]|uniref:HNH nuclease domain-containing protein n=1 Tax=Botrytis deweyae TaxID=2478750 RepID=A0ABQ7IF33_9HELO|nr:uncharacterized protein EAE98_008460 [Botrytis deweyae]KAF7921613.1 hypothetical protein EAE98_008460 [Botrytis deweyae]